ncbi:magnesium or manganese-dependent protein phosphatase [Saccharopolyspora erythraea NRRL 2338]|uniref:Magnesium or manganese-dependent protein phosphatase n=1 Tax=Saccharopolyspora erythraea (strain ATCC 11635 / DSM 40517 / JCM 4748 / NBRC 13426 / NCIMB 8594 / NRRL 2338) TaxID=405948 RepID=A4FHZ8_SACEN|nr:magnesium or manganese-dependent protein phosphatase [Saccharopolyspora erythraea NRRL 2338]
MKVERAQVLSDNATVSDAATRAAATIEDSRLAAVARYDILDTPPDGPFDRVAALAAKLLRAPVATVSIVDADRIWFKATHGLHGVTEIERAPGLCASAIQQEEPYVVTDALTDPRTAGNPLVHGEMGVRFYAAAPITTSDGHRLGTVDILDTRPRQIGQDELDTLRELAGVVMDALELRRSAQLTLRKERRARGQMERITSALQRSLLPPSLPSVPGLEVACHYHAASPAEVTGDFYDVFALGGGRWAFFLGDVTGHGAQAAAVTSLTRYTLRAAALHSQDPAAVLAELNAALLLDPNVPQHCTVLFGLLRPEPTGGFEITLAGGGHPPALRTHSGSGVVEEIFPGGMLVGALPDAEFESCRLHLREGQTLLLYTDGLTEARPRGEFFGEEGLKAFLASHPTTSASEQISELTGLLAGFDPGPTDDVALLALSVKSPTS